MKTSGKIRFEWTNLVLEGVIVAIYSNGDFAVQLTDPVYDGLVMRVFKEEVIS
jgi:hypothetical protein